VAPGESRQKANRPTSVVTVIAKPASQLRVDSRLTGEFIATAAYPL